MVNNAILVIMAATMSVSFAAKVSAQDEPKGFGVGLGYINELSEYREAPADDDGAIEIFFTYESERVHLQREQLAVDLWRADNIRFSLIGEGNGEGFEADDKRVFRGLAERDSSLELGGQVSVNIAGGNLRLAALKDVSDAHDGEIVKLRYDKRFQAGKWLFTPEIGVTRYSQEFVDYYYGVRSNEVAANRTFYRGEAARVAHVGLQSRYAVTPRFSVVSDMQVVTQADEIKNSPLVDDRSSKLNAFLGLHYQFK